MNYRQLHKNVEKDDSFNADSIISIGLQGYGFPDEVEIPGKYVDSVLLEGVTESYGAVSLKSAGLDQLEYLGKPDKQAASASICVEKAYLSDKIKDIMGTRAIDFTFADGRKMRFWLPSYRDRHNKNRRMHLVDLKAFVDGKRTSLTKMIFPRDNRDLIEQSQRR